MTRQRLQKLIAAAGLCSRRKAELLLQQGRVTVDQQLAGLGDQADPEHQLICVDGRPLLILERRRVAAWIRVLWIALGWGIPKQVSPLPPQEGPT